MPIFTCFILVDDKGQNEFGLKYLDTSSLEFGRKIGTDSKSSYTTAPSVDHRRVGYDSINEKTQDKTTSSLYVSSSETVQIEKSLNSQDLVKPSRVKKRNFSSKIPLNSVNVLNGHIDSSNFRHATRTPDLNADTEVINIT